MKKKVDEEIVDSEDISCDDVLRFIHMCNIPSTLRRVEKVLSGKMILLADGIIKSEEIW